MSSVTETYFPHLLEILKQDPSAVERLKLDCGMCMEEMTSDGEVKHELPNGDDCFSHRAYIFPCGHIFGLSCVMRLRNHTFHESLHRRVENKCPTCRQRLHYIPCKCPHVLGVLLEVEEAKRQEMLYKIDRIKSMCDRCFACGLKIIAWKMQLELNPSNGVEVEEDDSEMQFQMTLMPPNVKMIFKRTENYGEWGIKAIRVENRRYAPHDLDLEIHRLLDRFVNQMAEIYFTNRLISGEGIVHITAEISVAVREYSLIEFEHS
ncbi:hypothetical protein FSPOR_11756 [Fusarium sporotrichioides]|uniref:RING-type domain-containing protein n=1 Tax=Fusarium sporotrichioides TaxID=5514 RepID=A0A395RFF2_FUSSP|nr:hypothetical protein FSPOR_11756 [Fusarium sporotrichioides]